MNPIDWLIVGSYILAIILISVYVGRSQHSQEDYYLAGRSMASWKIALSVMATQVSAISLIGAPAFIALKIGGGLVWLQYELAIPLAMALIMFILLPIYHRCQVISIYEYLEKRFGGKIRTLVSLTFLISRGLGAGVMLLATSIVLGVCLGWDIYTTILLIGFISILYTTIGGIAADIYSDIIQLIVLWGSSLALIGITVSLIQWDAIDLTVKEIERLNIINFHATGFGDGQTFGFWPMLIGGLFLYFSYYGCDQSQTQRLLATPTLKKAQWALFLNGLFRFPLVLTYCAFGLLLIPFLHTNESFATMFKTLPPDYLVPYFLQSYVPQGFLGIVIAGICAASMSSLDSTLNSLSASTWRDMLLKFYKPMATVSHQRAVVLSRYLTVIWGVFCTGFAILMVGGSETVLELVNKIGSAFYGPIASIFVLGMTSRRSNETGAIAGLIAGVGINLSLWLFFEHVSWLWWNPIGFMATYLSGFGISFILVGTKASQKIEDSILNKEDLRLGTWIKLLYVFLLAAFIAMILFCVLMENQLIRMT
ncbi:sodium/solute symporter [bacterium]|nr:sodium/solute symporter [bacterium]